MMAPGLIFFIVWHYVPIWEAKMAFEQVRIIPPNIWVGLKNFQVLFSSPIFYQVLANTLIISGMKILFVFPVPIIVALLLNEIRSGKLRGTIQSAIYLPHFLSWVVISGVFIALLSPTDGAVNQIQTALGFQPISYMTNTGTIRWVLVISEIWRSAGWPPSSPSIRSFMKPPRWMAPIAGRKLRTSPFPASCRPSRRSSFSIWACFSAPTSTRSSTCRTTSTLRPSIFSTPTFTG
jgi:hypothetical protein